MIRCHRNAVTQTNAVNTVHTVHEGFFKLELVRSKETYFKPGIRLTSIGRRVSMPSVSFIEHL